MPPLLSIILTAIFFAAFFPAVGLWLLIVVLGLLLITGLAVLSSTWKKCDKSTKTQHHKSVGLAGIRKKSYQNE